MNLFWYSKSIRSFHVLLCLHTGFFESAKSGEYWVIKRTFNWRSCSLKTCICFSVRPPFLAPPHHQRKTIINNVLVMNLRTLFIFILNLTSPTGGISGPSQVFQAYFVNSTFLTLKLVIYPKLQWQTYFIFANFCVF